MRLSTPLVHCLSPKKITNPYTGESLLVPCGHCEACSLKKSSMSTLKCRLESQSNRYTYFVTLTYRNDCIPRAELVDAGDGFTNLVSVEDGDILTTVSTDRHSLYFIRKKVNLGGQIPVLYIRDVQLFIKRLRKQFPNEKIRFYYTGEYGPVHFRPHYHLLLWFNEPWTAANLSLAVRKSWRFGRVSTERAKDAAQYVAAYLNSSCHLPKILKTGKARPFANHSYFLGEKFLLPTTKEIFSFTPSEFIKRSMCINGRITNFSLWRSCIASSYPKSRKYGKLSYDEQLFSYGLYEKLKKEYGIKSAYKLAKYVIDEILSETDFDSSLYCFNTINPRRQSLHAWIIRYCDINVHDSSFDSYQRYCRTLYNVLAVSRLFLYNADMYFDSDYKRYLDAIISFYKDVDYMRLTDFLSDLEEHSPCMSDSDFLFCYNNTPFDADELQSSTLFLKFANDSMVRFYRSVKHKEQNDANLIFNNL